jgi:hypothetical protein
MAIDTNIPQIKTPTNYIYTARNLAINDISYSDGDGTLTVPRFDSYVMFDFDQTDLNGRKFEVDFSGMGDAYLCFVDNNIEVKIKNLNNIENINKGLGQVVFKISSDNSRKIYGMQTRYFFVTTKITQLNSVTEETVVYSGIWQKSGESERTTFEDLIAPKNAEYNNLNETYKSAYESFEKQQNILNNSASILEEEKNKTKILSFSIAKVQIEIGKSRNAVQDKSTTGSNTQTPGGTPDPNAVNAAVQSATNNEEKVVVINHTFFGDNGTKAKKLAKFKFMSSMNTLFALIDNDILIPKPSLDTSIKIKNSQYNEYLATSKQTSKLMKYYSVEFTDSSLKVTIMKKYKTDFLNFAGIEYLTANIEDIGDGGSKKIKCSLKEALDNIDEILTDSGQGKIKINV